jgi:signal transduction histidine kinase
LDLKPQFVTFLVEEALEALEQTFHEKRISVVLDLGSLEVVADRYTVVAILRNLLSNAMKFTKPGGQVTVSTKIVGERVAIEVQDTGIGIAAHRLPRLFRLGDKSSTLGTSREPGTGLGLILCAEFAQKNCGSLEVKSQEGAGTQFTLLLPVLQSIALN